jgi:hypothetical protein
MDVGFGSTVSVSDSGKKVNEDLRNTSETGAWVFDGGTGYADSPLTGADSDAKWYVDTLDGYLAEHVDSTDRSLRTVLREGIQHTRREYLDRVDDLPAPEYRPTAAGTVVRLVDGTVEYLVLGDCTLVVSKPNTVARVTDPRMEPIEQMAIEAVVEHVRTQDVSVWEARDAVADRFEQNRALANTAEGYWILSLDPDAVAHSLTGTFQVDDGTTAYLMTDGFSAVVDTYGLFDDWTRAVGELDDGRTDELLAEIRAVERSDDRCLEHPRTKPSDDATVLGIEFITDSAE